jgi:hypothetical protein
LDIFAHALWVGIGLTVSHRRRSLARNTALVTVALATLPDIAHGMPLIVWAIFGDGSFAKLWAYAFSLPGQEPVMPTLVASVAHHLHCIFHSAIVAGTITIILWKLVGKFWIPLLGWWSHIVIDVFTHSADFYGAPIFYPMTQRSFDGIAWNTPWFIALNYSTLALCICWLWMTAPLSKKQ